MIKSDRRKFLYIACFLTLLFCCSCASKNELQEQTLKSSLQNFEDIYYTALVTQDSSRLSQVVTDSELNHVLGFYDRNLSQDGEVIYIQRTVVEQVLVLEVSDKSATLFADVRHYTVRFNKVTGEQNLSNDPPRKSAVTIYLKLVNGTWKFDGAGETN